MTGKEFKNRIVNKYPEKQITFRSNEIEFLAVIDGFSFISSPYSDEIKIFWNGSYCGLLQ